jgi:hypothetical protein
MNIFVLNDNPTIAAKEHCDQHVVKMPLETAQMLSTVLHQYGINGLYKPCFQKHPCTIWTGVNRSNFRWLCKLGLELCAEYTRRYGKIHKSQTVIEQAYQFVDLLPTGKLTPFALAMPIQYQFSKSAVVSYRCYYVGEKKKFATYKTKQPRWFQYGDIFYKLKI